jgi:RHS repeat-associated protein
MRAIVTTRIFGAYGGHNGSWVTSRSAFSGEAPEATTGWYLFGERLYSPMLRRFLAPDHTSPMDRGGVNRHAYCGGDPINRIDPSGNTWLSWLGASQGITGGPGAARNVTSGPRGSDAVTTTPVTMTAAAAAVTDAVSITAAIDSVALTMSGSPKAGGLFGWVAAGTRVTSAGSALPSVRKGPPQQRFLGSHGARTRAGGGRATASRRVRLLEDKDIPLDRFALNENNRIFLPVQWTGRAHASHSNSKIWAASSPISANNFPHLFEQLKKRGVTKLKLYTGTHGDRSGMNWNPITGDRLDSDPQFLLQDQLQARRYGRDLGITVDLVDMGAMKRDAFAASLEEDGVHVIGSCFGVADEVVMEAMNVSQVTLYRLNVARP